MKIFLVHGFNQADRGASTTGRMRKYYEQEGYDVEELSYPWMFVLGTYGLNWYHAKRFAKILKNETEPFVLVGHSNGNAIILKMIEDYGCKPKGWVAINPALDSDTVLPKLKFIHVYYNYGDEPVKWAKWLPLHPWGAMGRTGYTGRKRKTIQQWNCGLYEKERACVSLYGHSDMFTKSHVGCWTVYTAKNILSSLEKLSM